MKPMTLFLLDPSPEDVESGLSEGRVAAVFTDSEKRKAVRTAFAAKAKAGELIDLGADNLQPFVPDRPATPLAAERGPRMLAGAALALLGVPRTVVVTSEHLFGAVADALRQEARTPRSLRFKGWPEGRKQDLLRLGFNNVAVVGAPSGDRCAEPGASATAGIGATPASTAATDPFEGCTFHAWR